MAVHDLGQEIALDAVEAAVDFGFDVAVGGDHAAILGRDHDAAAGAAEPARRLVPFQFGDCAFGDEILRRGRRRNAARGGRHRGGFQLQKFPSIQCAPTQGMLPLSEAVQASSVPWNTNAADNTSGSNEIVVQDRANRSGVRCLDNCDKLASRVAAIDLGPGMAAMARAAESMHSGRTWTRTLAISVTELLVVCGRQSPLRNPRRST